MSWCVIFLLFLPKMTHFLPFLSRFWPKKAIFEPKNAKRPGKNPYFCGIDPFSMKSIFFFTLGILMIIWHIIDGIDGIAQNLLFLAVFARMKICRRDMYTAIMQPHKHIPRPYYELSRSIYYVRRRTQGSNSSVRYVHTTATALRHIYSMYIVTLVPCI